MESVVVFSAATSTAATAVAATAVYCIVVCSPKSITVPAAMADTLAGPAVDEWVIFYPSDVPTKFVIVAATLHA
jgi:hypothetical protein